MKTTTHEPNLNTCFMITAPNIISRRMVSTFDIDWFLCTGLALLCVGCPGAAVAVFGGVVDLNFAVCCAGLIRFCFGPTNLIMVRV